MPDEPLPDEPLPIECLEPVRAGITACRELWEPMLGEARVRPVELLATNGYDVWLEAHGRTPQRVAPGEGTVHLITPVIGDLAVRYPSGGGAPAARLVSTGHTVAGDGEELLVGSATPGVAFAIHVHSPRRPAAVPASCPWAPDFAPVGTARPA